MSNEFSQRMSEILSLSKEEATRLRSNSIKPEHLLLGIIRKGKGCALDILNSLNVNIQSMKEALESRSSDGPVADLPYSASGEVPP